MKRRGKSPPPAVATRGAVPLAGCKAMYTGIQGLLARCRGVGRLSLRETAGVDKWRKRAAVRAAARTEPGLQAHAGLSFF